MLQVFILAGVKAIFLSNLLLKKEQERSKT